MHLRSLTKNESIIMDVFWKEGIPLSSVDLMKILEEKEWNSSYVVTLLRTLKKKGFIEMCGTVRHSTQYARQFKWIVSKEEYVASLILDQGIGLEQYSGLTMAFVKESCGDMDQKKALMKLIEELKKEEELP